MLNFVIVARSTYCFPTIARTSFDGDKFANSVYVPIYNSMSLSAISLSPVHIINEHMGSWSGLKLFE